MTVTHAVGATILNRLRVSLDAGAVAPASGTSVDANVGGAGQLVIGASNLSGATGVLVTIPLQHFTLCSRWDPTFRDTHIGSGVIECYHRCPY